MAAITFEDIFGPVVVTAVSGVQMITFAQRVGKARKKFKILPPATTGDDRFVRVFRAQQNCVEFYPVFLAGLWSSSLLFHQVPSSLLAVLYLIGREKYFVGYSEAPEKRMQPFKSCMLCLVGFTVCSVVGMGSTLFLRITGKALISFVKS